MSRSGGRSITYGIAKTIFSYGVFSFYYSAGRIKDRVGAVTVPSPTESKGYIMSLFILLIIQVDNVAQ